jgi:hypothetical protein
VVLSDKCLIVCLQITDTGSILAIFTQNTKIKLSPLQSSSIAYFCISITFAKISVKHRTVERDGWFSLSPKTVFATELAGG